MSDDNDNQLNLAETGRGGARSDRRLFMQLLAYGGVGNRLPEVTEALKTAGVVGAVYTDLHDPSGVAIVVAHENPTYFLTQLRRILQSPPFSELTAKPELTMFGRSYAIGYEPDLEDTLINRPLRTLTDEGSPWAVWYPLRRKGGFERLDRDARMSILREHGGIGRRFVEAGVAADIRLACYGLDRNDNDFVIGLIGPELAPLSKLVETMRQTDQTSNWLESLGPFVVGYKVWQNG